jgi:hypothetical protein
VALGDSMAGTHEMHTQFCWKVIANTQVLGLMGDFDMNIRITVFCFLVYLKTPSQVYRFLYVGGTDV